MAENRIFSSRYIYKHDASESPKQTVDIHHVVIRKNGLWKRVVVISSGCLLLSALYVLLGEDKSLSGHLLYLGIGAIFFILLQQKIVDKESVIIIPAFGIQLETHYRSGRAVRHFVPIDKILKPVLNECVTPVTCYWSLALILRDEDQLMLVFKELRPPLKILLPVWKALCAATETRSS